MSSDSSAGSNERLRKLVEKATGKVTAKPALKTTAKKKKYANYAMDTNNEQRALQKVLKRSMNPSGSNSSSNSLPSNLSNSLPSNVSNSSSSANLGNYAMGSSNEEKALQKVLAKSMANGSNSFPSNASSLPNSASNGLPSIASNNLNEMALAMGIKASLKPAGKPASASAATSKPAAASAKPKAPKERALPAFGPNDYLQFDTLGDGNCFYRSLYNAAKFHVIPGTFERLLRCLRLPADISEKAFSDQLRKIVAREVRGDLLNRIAQADNPAKRGFTIYHQIRQAAALAIKEPEPGKEREVLLWQSFREEASTEFKKQFLKSPKYFLKINEEDFKNRLATIVTTDCVFVSELDYMLVDFILKTCGPNAVRLRLVSPGDTLTPEDAIGGVPNILIRRVQNHYNFFVKASKFLETPALVHAAKFGSPSQAIEAVFTADRSAALRAQEAYAVAAKKKQDALKVKEAAAAAKAAVRAAEAAQAKTKREEALAAAAAARAERAKTRVAKPSTSLTTTRKKAVKLDLSSNSSSSSNSSNADALAKMRAKAAAARESKTQVKALAAAVSSASESDESSGQEFMRRLREMRAKQAAMKKAPSTTRKQPLKAVANIPEPPGSDGAKAQEAQQKLAASMKGKKVVGRRTVTRKAVKAPVLNYNSNTESSNSSNSNNSSIESPPPNSD